MSRYKTLYNNTLIFTISNFASKILAFLMLPLYTRVLSTAEFGTSDLIVLTVGLLLPMLTLSISDGTLRFALEENEDKKQVFSFGLRIIIGGFILMLALFPLIILITILKEYIILFYLIYISQALNNYFNQFVRGINKIKLIGVVGVMQTIITVASNLLLLVVFRLGIEGLLLSIIISNTSAFIILFWFGDLNSYITLKTIEKRLKREMLKFSLPLTPTKLSWWINNAANKYIITGYSGVSEVGLFSAASRMPSILVTIQGIFSQAWQLSAISEYEKENSIDFFSKIYKIYNLIMLLGCSVLISIIKPLSYFLFGEDFFNAWKFVPFLLIATIFGALSGFLGSINIAEKKTISLFLTTFAGAAVGIILNFIFIPKYGAIAASIIAAFSYLIIWVIRLIDSLKYMKLQFSYIKDIFSYSILVIQSIITISMDTPNSYVFSGISLIGLVVINYRTLVALTNRLFLNINK